MKIDISKIKGAFFIHILDVVQIGTKFDNFTCVVTCSSDPNYRKEYDIINYIKTSMIDAEVLRVPELDLYSEDTLYKFEFTLDGNTTILEVLDMEDSMAEVIKIADTIGLKQVDESDVISVEFDGEMPQAKITTALVATTTATNIVLKLGLGDTQGAYTTLIKLKNELNVWKTLL